MWPWGHLAVGYLCYLVVVRLRDDAEQTAATLTAVAFGTQFPDLVDKPLAWTFAVLPSGRSLAHSLLVAAAVAAAAYYAGRRYDRVEAAFAFAVGYVSHCLSDLGPGVVAGLLRGDAGQLEWTTYLLWPVLPSPPYPHDESFLQHFAAFAFDPFVLAQFALFVVAVGAWLASGAPGLGTVYARAVGASGRRDSPRSGR